MTCTGYLSVYSASSAESAACSAPVVPHLKISTCPETAEVLVELPPLQPALNTTAPTHGAHHPNRPISTMLLTCEIARQIYHTALCRLSIHLFLLYPKMASEERAPTDLQWVAALSWVRKSRGHGA